MWQGRYSLPFTAGVIMLAGLVLDRVRWRSNPRDVRPQALALVMLAVAHVISVVHVQLAELDRAVSAGRCRLAPPADRRHRTAHGARLGRPRSRGALAAAARPGGSRCGPGPRRGHAGAESTVTDDTVSVLLPVHAGVPVETFRAALDSLAAQTRPADEVVVVEDGPLTADHDRVIDHYAASRDGVVRVRLAINQGAGVANGAGLQAATGTWIAKMDADDLLLPRRFETQLAALERDRRGPVRRGHVGVRPGPRAADPAAHQPRHSRGHRPADALQQPDQPPDRDVPARARPASGRLPHDAVHAGLRPDGADARRRCPDDQPRGAAGAVPGGRRDAQTPLGPRLPGPRASSSSAGCGPTAWSARSGWRAT